MVTLSVFLYVLRFPPAVQRHTDKVTWQLYIALRCESERMLASVLAVEQIRCNPASHPKLAVIGSSFPVSLYG